MSISASVQAERQSALVRAIDAAGDRNILKPREADHLKDGVTRFDLWRAQSRAREYTTLEQITRPGAVNGQVTLRGVNVVDHNLEPRNHYVRVKDDHVYARATRDYGATFIPWDRSDVHHHAETAATAAQSLADAIGGALAAQRGVTTALAYLAGANRVLHRYWLDHIP